MTKSAGSTRSPWDQSSFGTWGSRHWTSPSLCANLHCRYTVPAPPGVRVPTGPQDQGHGPLHLCTQICTSGIVYPLPLRIKALVLSVFVRKSALQVHTVPAHPGGRVHMGPEDQGSGPLRLCTQICTSGTHSTHSPWGRVHMGSEDQGPGPLRLCAQICTAGTVYPLPLEAEFIRDLRNKALDLSSLCANLHCRYSVPTPPGVRVHTGPEDQGPGPLRLCTQICTSGTYTVPTPPRGRVHTGPEDQGPGPLRLCAQICTAGTLWTQN